MKKRAMSNEMGFGEGKERGQKGRNFLLVKGQTAKLIP